MNTTSVSGLTSVIVVTANSGATLLQCVEKILSNAAPLELIIVDNVSTDGSVELLRKNYASNQKIRFIYNNKNIGFGAAAHRGAENAQGDALLFLNPDCYLTPTTISMLRVILESTPNIGLLGTCILDPDGKPARVNRRREPTLRRSLMTLTRLACWEINHPNWVGIEISKPAYHDDIESVEAVSGAAMFIPQWAYWQIGGFDIGYFLHCEDLDLCRRVRDAGFKVIFAHNVKVTHAQGSSSHSRPIFVAWHKHRGMWRYFCKFDKAARNPLIRIVVWLGIWIHLLVLTPVYLWQFWQAKTK